MDQWTTEPSSPGRIAFRGELDLASSRDLRPYLIAQLATAERIELDLSAVEFIDSAGLHTLIDAYHHATSRGAEFVLVAPSLPVRQLLELTGCIEIFTITGGS